MLYDLDNISILKSGDMCGHRTGSILFPGRVTLRRIGSDSISQTGLPTRAG
jgi:hypothetical protein